MRNPIAAVVLVAGGLLAFDTGQDVRVASADTTTIDIVGPAGSGTFGATVHVLSGGNFVVGDSSFDGPSEADIGAVYLYNGKTRQLISVLTGSRDGDRVGSHGIVEVGSGNFIVRSPSWTNGTATGAGAVTWVNGATGLNGTVSPSNSLVGSSLFDGVGAASMVLANGNYLVGPWNWDNGAAINAGAVTWGSGAEGVRGPITSANSLVGTTTGDQVGIGGNVAVLANGNYVVGSYFWRNGLLADAGAATWGNGASGVVGAVSASNSLVGTTAGDNVGFAVQALTNGNYVVRSPNWDGPATNVGAATWGTGAGGLVGPVTTSNSLHGTTQDDFVGTRAVALANGNYLVESPSWDRPIGEFDVPNVGSVTWGRGDSGVTGAVGESNSLIGGFEGDRVGAAASVALANGNYVLRSVFWHHFDSAAAGAVTWGNGSTGTTGVVTTANSLYGVHPDDFVGDNVLALSNGNYLVTSARWNNGSSTDAGAVTWGNGSTGTSGEIGATNSWVGTQSFDAVGNGNSIALTNGNAVFSSPSWSNGAVPDAGASTWVNGAVGGSGPIGATNSLVGTTANDGVGANAFALSNGNYVVVSDLWNEGLLAASGAVTWGDGSTGITGAVSAANSVTGSRSNDRLGSGGVLALDAGNYVVISPMWDRDLIADVGAATFRRGNEATSGNVTTLNSLVGVAAGDSIGEAGTDVVLPGGAFLLSSPMWDNGSTSNAGAVTYGDPTGVVGMVSPTNSVRGSTADGGFSMSVGSMPTSRGDIVVGRPADNTVTLLVPPPKPDYTPLAPARLVDTRPGFATADGIHAGDGARELGSTFEVTVAGRGGVALDARAASLNVTAVDSAAAGYVTVFPCGEQRPTASNLNVTTGATVPNAVLAKIGANGKVCVFVSQPMHLVVDVNGFFPATSSYQPSNPARLMDTRAGFSTFDGAQQGEGLRPADGVTELQVAGRAGIPADATAVALNVTVTDAEGPGYATVFPCGASRPTASTLNYTTGGTVANLSIAKIGAGGKVCVYTQLGAHLIADANGYLPFVTTYMSLNPARLLETRAGLSTIDGLQNGTGFVPGSTVTMVKVAGRGGVPDNAATVVLNVTATEPVADGYVTAYPCGIDPPLASNVNHAPGQTVANAALVKVGVGGHVCLFNSQPTHVIVDVAGFLPP